MILKAAKTFVSAFSLCGVGHQEAEQLDIAPAIKSQIKPPGPSEPKIQIPTVDAIVESIRKTVPDPPQEPMPPLPKPNPKPRPVKRDVPYPPRRPIPDQPERPIRASWGLPPREFVPYLVSGPTRRRPAVQIQPTVYSEPAVQAYEPVRSVPVYQPSFSTPLGWGSGFGGLGPATGGCAGGSCR